jgi:hypothetical protein
VVLIIITDQKYFSSMKSELKTQKNSCPVSPTFGVERIHDPPTIGRVRYSSPVFDIRGWPYCTYIVLDSFEVHLASDPTTPIVRHQALLCLEASVDMLSIPYTDPMACFMPTPGKGTYASTRIRRTPVVFWQGGFWAPLSNCEPNRDTISKIVYGQTYDQLIFDILYPVNVVNVPDVDLLKINTLDDTDSLFWAASQLRTRP